MKNLRALLVEDVCDDAELLLLALRSQGYDVSHRRVQTAAAMRDALAAQSWDVVLSDWTLPEFSALEALSLLWRSQVDLPFVIVSGTVDAGTMEAAVRAGAHDFICKGDLSRLSGAIETAVRAPGLHGHRISGEGGTDAQ